MATPPKPPDYIDFQITVDVAYKPISAGGAMSIGYVFFYKGGMEKMGGEIISATFIKDYVAALKAIKRGLEVSLEWFKSKNMSPEDVELHSNNILSIDLINGKAKTKISYILSELSKIKEVQSYFPRVRYVWRPRNRTGLAHDQAVYALERHVVSQNK